MPQLCYRCRISRFRAASLRHADISLSILGRPSPLHLSMATATLAFRHFIYPSHQEVCFHYRYSRLSSQFLVATINAISLSIITSWISSPPATFTRTPRPIILFDYFSPHSARLIHIRAVKSQFPISLVTHDYRK